MAPPGSPPLLERDAEVRALEAAIEAAAAGSGRLVVVEGPGGIGKSRLGAAARKAAERAGTRGLAARCSELERSFPFGVARQLFAPLLLDRAEPGRDVLFRGAAALAAPLLEEVGAPADAAGDELFSRLHGLYWLVANLAAQQPLLLLVDDAHWADDASLRFLGFLARRIGDLPVLLLVLSRPADEPTAARGAAALLTDPEALVLRPAPLSGEAVGELLRLEAGAAPDERFAGECLRATGGNPFLVGELAEAIRGAGVPLTAEAVERVATLAPARVAAVIAERLHRLSPAASLPLARALAILGDGVALRDAGVFAGIGEQEALDAARALEGAGIARGDEGLRFVHPIVRQAVYQDLGTIERGERHAEAAAFLRDRGAPPDRIAAHLLQAPPRADAPTVAALRAAAAQAMALGDPLAATRLLRRAVLEPPAPALRAALLLELGDAARGAGAPDAAQALEECLQLEPEPAVRAAAASALAELRVFSGRPDVAADVLERTIAAVGDATTEGRRLTAQLITGAHVSVPVRRRWLPRLAAIQDPGGVPGTPEELGALAALAAHAIMDRNDGARAAELALRAAAAPLPEPLDPLTTAALPVLVVPLMGAEEHAVADDLLSRLLERSQRAGARAWIASYSSLRALVRWRAGQVAAAEADALGALELLPEAHGAEMLAHAGAASAVLAGIDLERPLQSLEAILRDAPYHRDPDILPFSQVLLARGALRQAEGRHEEALEAFGACDRDDPGWGGRTPSLVPWRSAAAESLAALGREPEARRLAEDELRLTRDTGLPRARGIAERGLALVSPRRRREGLEASLAALEEARVPREMARTLVDLGRELARVGERSGAREALDRAHEIADRCGAQRIAREARQELRGAGTRPRSTAGQGLGGLTPAERRVADMAAEGRTNREIAQRLFLSEKTVETHLARVFRKLGLRSRRQLATAMA